MLLRYDLMKAALSFHEQLNPISVIEGLGITYRNCIPLSDAWWFFNCANIPEGLPIYIASQSFCASSKDR